MLHNLRHIIINGKTSVLGLGMILSGVGDFLQQLVQWEWDAQRLFTDWVSIIGGLGLLFAKDAG